MVPDNDFSVPLEQSIPCLRAYARSLLQNADAADDLVQDALLRAWSAREQFTAGTNLNAWVLTILRNRFLDQKRRDRGSNIPLDELVLQQLMCRPSQDSAIQFSDMARAFWRLSPRHREILILVGAKGLGYAEAAAVIGCAVGTVRSRLSRARSELQALLEQGRDDSDMGIRRGVPPQPGAPEFLMALSAA